MTTPILLALLLTLLGFACMVGVLSSVWPSSTAADDPVGDRMAPRSPAPPKTPPMDLRTMVFDVSDGWKRPDRWLALTQKLDLLEVQLGGTPSAEPAPATYAPEWLEARVAALEELAGPMPAPYRLDDPTTARGT